MEAHTIIGKLPIFLVWKFELFYMVSKIEIDLNQFWFLNFYFFAWQEFAFDKYL